MQNLKLSQHLRFLWFIQSDLLKKKTLGLSKFFFKYSHSKWEINMNCSQSSFIYPLLINYLHNLFIPLSKPDTLSAVSVAATHSASDHTNVHIP